MYSKDWTIEVIDIEAAFLEGEITEPTFIHFPEGMEQFGFIREGERDNYCIELKKSMYGNVDAALKFFQTYSAHLINTQGMRQSQADPCVFIKEEEDKIVLIAMTFVDDTILFGTKTWIEWFKKGVEQRFKYTDEGKLKKHLGIAYEWKQDEEGEPYIEATMNKMIEGIINAYDNCTSTTDKKEFNTPGIPHLSMTKSGEEEQVRDMHSYRKIVGKILYLVTKIMPEGANAARELSRFFSNPGEEHWKSLQRFVGYLRKHKDKIKLTLRKPREMRVGINVDSNYATNKEDRRSVTGAIYTLGGMITNWLSKTQPIVTLSSCEAEYCSLATAAQELIFMQMLLKEFGLCKTPGMILEDNTGAIFLVKNQQVGARTKHIDVRHHFIRGHYNNGELHVQFCRSEDNEADIATKNLPEDVYEKFASKIREGRMRVYEEWNDIVKEVSG